MKSIIVVALLLCVAAAAACDYNVTSVPEGSELTVEQINDILEAHNAERRQVSPYAKVMPMLQYSVCLEKLAKDHFASCPGFDHSSTGYRTDKCEYSYVGENMAVSSGEPYRATDAVSQWNKEKQHWTYPRECAAGEQCGHYTQVIWADTTHVGCYYKLCTDTKVPPHAYAPTSAYWVCEYGKGGNYKGAKPYEKVEDVSDAAPCTDKSKTTGGTTTTTDTDTSTTSATETAQTSITTITTVNDTDDNNDTNTPSSCALVTGASATLLLLLAAVFY